METLITLSYIALCVIIFRVFKVPKNKWTITTSVVIGGFLLGWIFLYMAMYQPVSRMAGIYSITTPITSTVSGYVDEVYVEGNKPLKKGDPLYHIDETPFIAKLNATKARIGSAEANIAKLKIQKTISQKTIEKTLASITYTKLQLARYKDLNTDDFVAKQSVDQLTDQFNELTAEQAQNFIELDIDDANITEAIANKNVEVANLADAQFNLDNTTVRAPTDGYVTQVALRPGMKSRVVPFQGNLTFVHKEDKHIFAAFKQNPARYIKPGYKAEVTFKTVPGHAFEATVVDVLDIFAQGAVLPSGMLNDPSKRMGGRILVRIEINDQKLFDSYPMPAGTDAHVAVYSPDWEMFSVVRKVILRMQSWQNWLFEG